MINEQKIREKIVAIVYKMDSEGHYVGGYNDMVSFLEDFPEYTTFLLYHPRFTRLLWSKYTGCRYLPERFLKR